MHLEEQNILEEECDELIVILDTIEGLNLQKLVKFLLWGWQPYLQLFYKAFIRRG